MSCSRFLPDCCEKKSHPGKNLGYRGKFVLASGEDANIIWRKLARFTVRRTTSVILSAFKVKIY